METKKNKTRILLCEDDESLGMLLREYLEVKGYFVTLCVDGEMGYNEFVTNKYDLCILDVMMPKMDGFTLAGKIKEEDSEMPFMFLTAKTMRSDVKDGFELGADDYITKPFSMEEVVLRIEAIMRRVNGASARKSKERFFGSYKFDLLERTLTHGDEKYKLTDKEAELLILLSNKPNDLITRDYALRSIWADDSYFNARSMDVYVTKLRKIIKDDPSVYIENENCMY